MIVALVLLAALSRLLPHPPNFTALGAVALFGSAYFKRSWMAYLIPFLALWISDLILNNMVYAKLYPEFYSGFAWFGNFYVYLGFGLSILLGRYMLSKVSIRRFLVASFAGGFLFFLITNLGSFIMYPTYPKTGTGLLACYTAGLPFLRSTLAGNLVFGIALFGAYELIAHYRYERFVLKSTLL